MEGNAKIKSKLTPLVDPFGADAGGGTVAWCTNTELDPVIRHRRIVSSTLKHSGE